jgi:ACR3 family arsenite efflux pump ArsB
MIENGFVYFLILVVVLLSVAGVFMLLWNTAITKALNKNVVSKINYPTALLLVIFMYLFCGGASKDIQYVTGNQQIIN